MPERDPTSLISIFGPIVEGADADYECDIALGTGNESEIIPTVPRIALSIWDRLSRVVIRRTSNVLEAGEGGVLTAGHFTMNIAGKHNQVLNQRLDEEEHGVLFEFPYTIGNDPKIRQGKIPLILVVQRFKP